MADCPPQRTTKTGLSGAGAHARARPPVAQGPMGLRPTKGDENRSVVRPVADAPGSVTEPEHGTPSVSEGLGAALLSTARSRGTAPQAVFEGMPPLPAGGPLLAALAPGDLQRGVPVEFFQDRVGQAEAGEIPVIVIETRGYRSARPGFPECGMNSGTYGCRGPGPCRTLPDPRTW